MPKRRKVLMICTGGTIAMLHKVVDDPTSPLVPATWEQIKDYIPSLSELPFDVETQEMSLIDSSDMSPSYWIDLVHKIRDNYNDFDGFVILHGTDTMSYTATALSFLLQNLSKPVIVTGSQLPLAQARSDAAQNLVTSLIIAAGVDVALIPEVCILFDNVLLRGNRSRKLSSTGFNGFVSPNYPPLAKIGEHIKVNETYVKKPTVNEFYVDEHLNPNVMIIDVFPGITSKMLHNIFAIPELKGVVLRTYGTGNAPTDPKLLKEIGSAVSRGIAIVNITQCLEGMVEMGLYDASVGLLRHGVCNGTDMTPEAALIKLMFLLGQGYGVDTVKERMHRERCGEQSVNVFNLIYEQGETDQGVTRFSEKTIDATFKLEDIAKVNIRLENVEIKPERNGSEVGISIFMNHPSANTETNYLTDSKCLGTIVKADKDMNFNISCTENFSKLISRDPIRLTLVSRGGDISWDSVVLSIYTNAMNTN